MKRSREFVWLIMALLLAACADGPQPLTQLVAVVDSDLRVPEQIDRVTIDIGGVIQPQHAAADLRTAVLPRALGIVHGGGPLGPIEVTARGLLDGRVIVERSARVDFVPGQTRELRLDLLRSCAGLSCGSGETCIEGLCTSDIVEGGELPPFTGDPVSTFDPDVQGMAGGGVAGTGSAGRAGSAGMGTGGTAGRRGGTGGRSSGGGAGTGRAGTGGTGTGGAGTGGGAGAGGSTEPPPLPTVSIDSVTQDSSTSQPFSTDAAIALEGSGQGDELTLTWTDSLLGVVGQGASVSIASPLPGRHRITLEATDVHGVTVSASTTFVVLPPGQSQLVQAPSAVNTVLEATGEPRVDSLVVTSAGRVFASNRPDGVYELTADDLPAGATLVLTSPELAGRAQDLFVAEEAMLIYVATDSGLTVCGFASGTGIDAGACTTHTGSDLPNDDVLSVLRMTGTDASDYLLIGTTEGLLVADMVAGSAIGADLLDGREITGMTAVSGIAFLATDGGLYRFDPATDQTTRFDTDDGLPSNEVRAVAIDTDGNVWIGTDNGLARYVPAEDAFTTWNAGGTPAPGLVHEQINAIAIERVNIGGVERDVIWVGTDGGVSRFDPTIPSFMSLSTADGLPDRRVLDIVVLSNGRKLFATEGGLALYTGP